MASLPPAEGSLAFTEARGCKEWLNALPLTNIPQAQARALEALRAMGRTELEGMEALKCLELMRDKIAFLQGEQRSRYFGKSLPLSANDSSAWQTGCSLLEEMEAGYRRCLERARAGEGELAGRLALIAQRVVRYIGAQMLFHAIVYRRFDPRLWSRLHAEFAAAEGAGIAEERVKDSLESEDSGSSVMEAYAHVVLLQAAYLSELSAPQMDFVESLLRLWIRRVPVRPVPAGAGALPLVVDLGKSIGARPAAPGHAGPGLRMLDVEQLSRSMRKRIHGLQKDEDPVSLGLPRESAALDPLHQLRRLHKLWCEGAPVRPPAKVPDEKTAGLAFGLGEIHFFVNGGKVFEQPDKSRELTRQEKQDIEVFGRVTERTQSLMLGELNLSLEPWIVVDESLGVWRLQRPPTASKGVAIGRLVAMRLGESAPFLLGMVSALAQETDGRIVITVTLFPGKPVPVAARAADARNRSNAKWVESFRLPGLDKARIPPSLVVPSGLGVRGRAIEIWEGDRRESTVREVLERGTDFDRVTTS